MWASSAYLAYLLSNLLIISTSQGKLNIAIFKVPYFHQGICELNVERQEPACFTTSVKPCSERIISKHTISTCSEYKIITRIIGCVTVGFGGVALLHSAGAVAVDQVPLLVALHHTHCYVNHQVSLFVAGRC